MNLAYRLLGYKRYRFPADYGTAVMELCREAAVPYTEFCITANGEYELVCRLFWGNRLEYGCALRQIPICCCKTGGLFVHLCGLLRRPGLCVGLIFAVLLSVISGKYIWFIRVDGNRTVSDAEVRTLLRQAGVYVGASFEEIDVDRAEATLLLKADAVSWVSVNRSGCVAEVQIREKRNAEETTQTPANVVASRSGVVEYVEMRRGNTVVKAGDVVQEGEILISGLFDSQTVGYRFVRAEGAVFARTAEEITVTVPLSYEKKVYTGEKSIERYVNFFDQRINISKKTGNVGGSCDTIESVEEFGFVGCPALPVFLVCCSKRQYRMEPAVRSTEEALSLAYYELNRQVAACIGAGMLLSKTVQTQWTADACILHCRFTCVRDIGKVSEFELVP